MDQDVELLRDLMFVLEGRQTSPRVTVIVSLEDVSSELGRLPEDIDAGLNRLRALGYIDGPGSDEPGFWFFRKLTRKGLRFVAATRDPRDWSRLKHHFASRDPASLV